MINYFLSVNYGTSNLIEEWALNIKNICEDARLVVVDNFKTIEERKTVIDITDKIGIYLIKSENIGYGRALNKAINLCFEIEKDKNFNIFAGNLDIEFTNLPLDLEPGKFVYIPTVKESIKINRNPFLTQLQKKVFPLYYLAGYFKSVPLLYFAITINKLFSVIPSNIWAVHGSLFCFNSDCIAKNEALFNEESFLYCEEMEFASYMENANVIFLDSEISIIHQEHAATSEIVTSRKKFFDFWWPSFNNWYKRWK